VLAAGKNAAKQLNYRTCQYGMKWGMWNLQGGGRWFEPSIAHYRKSGVFAGKTFEQDEGPGTKPGPVCSNGAATQLTHYASAVLISRACAF
jgi:hypothetical protein